jgi:hypothetical protein
MKPTFTLLTALLLAPLAALHAAEPATKTTATTEDRYPARRDWLLGLFSDMNKFSDDPNPKPTLPRALAKLQLTQGQDAAALEYASRVMDYRSKYDKGETYGQIFAYPPLARVLYMFGNRLSDQQRAHLKQGLLSRARDLLDHGTENHAVMRVASGYLFAQYFPGETWTDRKGAKRSSAELMAEAKRLLLARGKGFYRVGNNEALSTTYSLVNVYPLLNLYDFASDSEVKAIAEALILYHMTHLAVNDFDGHIMAPFNRQNSQQERFVPREQAVNRYTPIVPQVAWLYWGQNEVFPADFLPPKPPASDGYPNVDMPLPLHFALSDWTPPPVLDRIARGEGAPYAVRSSLGFFGNWGAGQPNETVRMVWRDKDFALGAGAQRFDPAGFYQDYNLFQIAWRSCDRFRYLECNQPYWRSNQGEDYWDKGANSPFMQAAVHRQTALVLFNVPEKDPWPGRGQQGVWPKMRDQHTAKLLAVGQCRFPKSVDELARDSEWFFLREGGVFIGIRPLRPNAELASNFPPGKMEDFQAIKSRHARTGFVFEVGTQAQHGNLATFQRKLKANPLAVNWDDLEVDYTNTSGDRLRLRYNPDLAERKGLVEAVPDFWVNGKALDFTGWPLLESPVATQRDSVLRIEQGGDSITVDWRGKLPIITRR